MMTKDFGKRFFGKNPFDKNARNKFKEEWSKMSDSEKLDFMNKRVEHMGQDRFSVEAIDARCEKWMKMTTEEKQVFINERKRAFEDRINGTGGFFGNHFGFGGGHRDCFFGAEGSQPTE